MPHYSFSAEQARNKTKSFIEVNKELRLESVYRIIEEHAKLGRFSCTIYAVSDDHKKYTGICSNIVTGDLNQESMDELNKEFTDNGFVVNSHNGVVRISW